MDLTCTTHGEQTLESLFWNVHNTMADNKQIHHGIFNFVKQKQAWTMSYVEAINISALPRKKFTQTQLWTNTPENFEEFKEEGENAMFQLQNQVKSKLLKEVESQFNRTNDAIRQDITQFI